MVPAQAGRQSVEIYRLRINVTEYWFARSSREDALAARCFLFGTVHCFRERLFVELEVPFCVELAEGCRRSLFNVAGDFTCSSAF